MTIKKQNAMHAREFKRKQQLLLKRNQSLVAQRGQCQIKLAFSVISRITFYNMDLYIEMGANNYVLPTQKTM